MGFRRWAAPALLVLLACVPLAATAVTTEGEDRYFVTQPIKAMVDTDDFAGLDALADRLRRSQGVTGSGEPQLDIYYDGVFSALRQRRASFRPLTQAEWAAFQAWLPQWADAFPASPTPHVLMALTLEQRALLHRGDGTEKQWNEKDRDAYQRYLAEATDYLAKHRKLASQDPMFYALLERIALRTGWQDAAFQALFDEGAQRFPTYWPIYFAAITRATPRWGGSVKRIEAVARDAMTRVPANEQAALYARLYAQANKEVEGDIFAAKAVDLSLLGEGIDRVIARYPNQWNLQRFADVACKAGDKARTRALLERRDQIDLEAWDDYRRYNQCVAYAFDWDETTP